MNNQATKNATIVKYLLGSLSEAESERLDELSISDDKFAAELSAAEKDLVDAYVQGELTGAELESFRAHYLASPLRRDKLDFAKAFSVLAEKHFNASSTATEEMRAERAPSGKHSKWFAGKSFFTTPRLSWQWGFAVAAIALLVAGSWLVFENMRLRQQMSQIQATRERPATSEEELKNELQRQQQAVAKTEQELARLSEERAGLEAKLKQRTSESQIAVNERDNSNQQRPSPRGLSIASFILTPQMRSVQQIPTVSIPAGTDQVSMQLELEPNDYSTYRVALIDQAAGQTLWRSRQLKARPTTSGKSLSVTFPSSLLRPQVYALRVMSAAAGAAPEVISDYPFKVVKQ